MVNSHIDKARQKWRSTTHRIKKFPQGRLKSSRSKYHRVLMQQNKTVPASWKWDTHTWMKEEDYPIEHEILPEKEVFFNELHQPSLFYAKIKKKKQIHLL